MRQCESKTSKGLRCQNQARTSSRFCVSHRGSVDPKRAAWITGGAALGNVLVPGLGGLAVGALTGLVFDGLALGPNETKRRVFVSFDFDNDRVLKDFIVGQAKLPGSPFEVVDCSLKEAAPMKTWQEKARQAIRSADLVVVVLGRHTHRAAGVLKEVRMAREAGIKVVQVIGYKSGRYVPVPDAGRVYAWKWKNLKTLFA